MEAPFLAASRLNTQTQSIMPIAFCSSGSPFSQIEVWGDLTLAQIVQGLMPFTVSPSYLDASLTDSQKYALYCQLYATRTDHTYQPGAMQVNPPPDGSDAPPPAAGTNWTGTVNIDALNNVTQSGFPAEMTEHFTYGESDQYGQYVTSWWYEPDGDGNLINHSDWFSTDAIRYTSYGSDGSDTITDTSLVFPGQYGASSSLTLSDQIDVAARFTAARGDFLGTQLHFGDDAKHLSYDKYNLVRPYEESVVGADLTGVNTPGLHTGALVNALGDNAGNSLATNGIVQIRYIFNCHACNGWFFDAEINNLTLTFQRNVVRYTYLSQSTDPGPTMSYWIGLVTWTVAAITCAVVQQGNMQPGQVIGYGEDIDLPCPPNPSLPPGEVNSSPIIAQLYIAVINQTPAAWSTEMNISLTQ